MNYNLLKLNMYSLAKNQQLLRATGGPEFNGLLFEEIIALEKEILAQFGLPVCQRYLNFFEFSDDLNDWEIDITISLLKMEADAYLKSSAITDKQLLQQAQENHLPATEVLPELKIPIHIYTLFIYEHVLLKSRDTLDYILEEFNKTKYDKTLDAIGRLVQHDAKLNKLAQNFLEDSQLKYLQAFVFDRFGLMSPDEYWGLVGMGVEVKWGN